LWPIESLGLLPDDVIPKSLLLVLSSCRLSASSLTLGECSGKTAELARLDAREDGRGGGAGLNASAGGYRSVDATQRDMR